MMRTSAIALVLAGCIASADQPEQVDPTNPAGPVGMDDTPGASWTGVGYGVEYQRVSTGNAILIAYGGYSAHLSYSAGWATELVDAKLGAANVGQIYAVQGPEDPGYDAKEIGNSKLRGHLVTVDDGVSPIFVIAHSSGSYVAHELLDQLDAAGSTSILNRITYANLEGGGSGLTDDIVAALHQLTFVYAHDPTLASGYSENSSAEQELGADYAPKATTFEVTVPSTGCASGYGWCLHDVVVTHRPHDAYSYDLADDYTDFVDRPLTTEYLDPLLVSP